MSAPARPDAGDRPAAAGSRNAAWLLGAALAVEAVLVLGVVTGGAAALPLPGLVLWAGAVAAWLFAGHVAGRSGGRSTLLAVWVGAVLVRLLLLPVPPGLSDDVWRYLWDGHVHLLGIDPYLHAPGDAALDSVATPWRDRINNPGIPTIYPPVAQLAFLGGAAAGGGWMSLKALWLLFDLLTGLLLQRTAARGGRDPLPVAVLWLWAPLLLVEVAWNAHLEPLGLAGLALVVALDRRGARRGGGSAERTTLVRRAGAGAALAWATLTKLAPALVLPVLARRHGTAAVVGFVAFAAVAYAPFLDAGPAVLGGLGAYASHWRFNATGFLLLEAVAPGRWPPRALAAAVVLGVVGWATLRRIPADRALLAVLGTALFLSPTLHPWYALWLLPLAALRRSLPWLLLTGTVFIGYLGLVTYQETGVWPQPWWGRLLLWGPPLLLLLRDVLRGRRPPAAPARDDP